MTWILELSALGLVGFALACIAACFLVVGLWDRLVWGDWGFFGGEMKRW